MKHSKKFILAAATAGVVGMTGIGASVLAATNSSDTNYPPIVQKIASTFKLDPAKVNDVFKQQRQDNQADRQAKLKSTLDQAVKDGKLTSDQETKLIAELKTLHEQNKADRTQNRQSFKIQLDQWAKDNGITNLDQILPAPPDGGMRHGGMMPDNNAAGDS
jgi:polyhydroxyalkanoate synthesis regulator phasin